MVKKTKLFGLPKIGSLRGSTSASLKIGEILAIRKVFGTGGRTYFALLVDRLITYTNKIGSSATRALMQSCIWLYLHVMCS